EAIDVCRRHSKFSGNIGDRRLAEAEAAEQCLGRVHDAYAGVVGLGLDLGAHGSTGDNWMTSDENHNSSVRNVKGDFEQPASAGKGGASKVWWLQRPAQPVHRVRRRGRAPGEGSVRAAT